MNFWTEASQSVHVLPTLHPHIHCKLPYSTPIHHPYTPTWGVGLVWAWIGFEWGLSEARCGHHVGVVWTPCGHGVEVTWVPCGRGVGITWTSCGCDVGDAWTLRGCIVQKYLCAVVGVSQKNLSINHHTYNGANLTKATKLAAIPASWLVALVLIRDRFYCASRRGSEFGNETIGVDVIVEICNCGA